MSLTVNSTMPPLESQGNLSQSQTSPNPQSGQPVNRTSDTVSLTSPNDKASLESAKTEVSKSASEVQQGPELDGESALKALHMVQRNILQNADTALQSQANNKPESALNLLAILQD